MFLFMFVLPIRVPIAVFMFPMYAYSCLCCLFVFLLLCLCFLCMSTHVCSYVSVPVSYRQRAVLGQSWALGVVVRSCAPSLLSQSGCLKLGCPRVSTGFQQGFNRVSTGVSTGFQRLFKTIQARACDKGPAVDHCSKLAVVNPSGIFPTSNTLNKNCINILIIYIIYTGVLSSCRGARAS